MLHPLTARTNVVAALAVLFAGLPFVAAAQELNRVYIDVRDRAGQPVPGLTAADFTVVEGGIETTVVSADPVGPMKVALLVDNGDQVYQAGVISAIRRGLAGFLEALPPPHEVAVLTIGRTIQQRSGFTADRAALKAAADSVLPDESAGMLMLDGVRDTWEERFEGDEPFPVFVLALTDGIESSAAYGNDEYGALITELVRNGVTIHAVLLSTAGDVSDATAVARYAENLAYNTGGLYESITTATEMEEALTRVATRMAAHHDEVSARYRVVYQRPDPPGTTMSAGVRRSGVQLGLFTDLRMADAAGGTAAATAAAGGAAAEGAAPAVAAAGGGAVVGAAARSTPAESPAAGAGAAAADPPAAGAAAAPAPAGGRVAAERAAAARAPAAGGAAASRAPAGGVAAGGGAPAGRVAAGGRSAVGGAEAGGAPAARAAAGAPADAPARPASAHNRVPADTTANSVGDCRVGQTLRVGWSCDVRLVGQVLTVRVRADGCIVLGDISEFLESSGALIEAGRVRFTAGGACIREYIEVGGFRASGIYGTTDWRIDAAP